MKTNARGNLSHFLLWVAVLLLGCLTALHTLEDGFRGTGIRVDRQGARVRLWNNGTYDKVVTHLVAGPTEATLPRPILLRNHKGIKEISLNDLDWRDMDGNRVNVPTPNDEIGAVLIDAVVQMR